MAELPERDAALLLDMLLAARDARSFVDELDEPTYLESRLHQNAIIRSLEVIGEAAGKVSPTTQASHPEIPWREITGMRHRLIHGYAEVRLDPREKRAALFFWKNHHVREHEEGQDEPRLLGEQR